MGRESIIPRNCINSFYMCSCTMKYKHMHVKSDETTVHIRKKYIEIAAPNLICQLCYRDYRCVASKIYNKGSAEYMEHIYVYKNTCKIFLILACTISNLRVLSRKFIAKLFITNCMREPSKKKQERN